ncbi:MAG TPA: transketolase C-terminal domain-containing protein [Bdellovibrionota bacterium]|jgi:transketolase|nr:transketolase C-terminal domain-containing protein [Bdellovibrionota bacterium]
MTTKYFDQSIKAKATRDAFGEGLEQVGSKNSKVVALDADLSKSTKTEIFAKKFPERFFNVGIAEANMVGVAAGLARAGYVPFAASFACFVTGRFDQIRMSVSFSGAPVKIVGTHAGVGIGEDGHSQMGLEDLGMMRALPEMVVFQPADELDTKRFVEWTTGDSRAAYLRLTRQKCPAIASNLKSKTLEEGKWEVLDKLSAGAIVILATGGAFEPAAGAAEALKAKGHTVCLVNAHWIQPLDEDFLREVVLAKAKLIVSVEDHYIKTGLGGAVAETLSQWAGNPPLLRLGVEDFGQSAPPEDNMKHYGLTPVSLASRIETAIK